MRSITRACITLCIILLISCSQSAVKSLPELDSAKADSLVQVKGHELWITSGRFIDDKIPVTTDTGTVLPLHRACASVDHFRQYVFYPVTICRRPDEFIDLSQMSTLFAKNDSVGEKVNSKDKKGAFKMSSTARFNFQNPLWCRQLSGPWIAEIVETQSCGNVNLFRTQVTLTGVAGSYYWEWWGRFSERAAEFGLDTYQAPFGVSGTRIDCNSGDMTNCNQP